jgi:class 3 adenylate cyclase
VDVEDAAYVIDLEGPKTVAEQHIRSAVQTIQHQRSEVMKKTVVELDLVGYSTICDNVEQALDVQSVAQLNQQIQDFIEAGLSAVNAAREQTVVKTTGDGALLVFDSAQDAHRFVQAVHEATHARNLSRKQSLAKRVFRSGAATGEVDMQPKAGGGFEIAGMTIARAKRPEAQALPGGLLVDGATYEGLSVEQRRRYGAKTRGPGKRDEEFEAYPCQLNADGPKDVAFLTASVGASLEPARVSPTMEGLQHASRDVDRARESSRELKLRLQWTRTDAWLRKENLRGKFAECAEAALATAGHVEVHELHGRSDPDWATRRFSAEGEHDKFCSELRDLNAALDRLRLGADAEDLEVINDLRGALARAESAVARLFPLSGS